MGFEMIWEVWRIIERKDGAVFRLEFVEERWLPAGSSNRPSRPDDNPDLMWIASSKEKNWRIVRHP